MHRSFLRSLLRSRSNITRRGRSSESRMIECLEDRSLLAATFSVSTLSLQTTANLGVLAADLNGDTNIDIAASNNSGFDNVLLGNGNATFGSLLTHSAGVSTPDLHSIASGNILGSSLPELVVGSFGSGGVRVMVNNGGGSFSPGPFFSAGGAVVGVAVGDLNGDGINDIVASRFQLSSVAIFYSNGSGGIITSAALSTGSAPIEVLIADVDNNGTKDIVSVNRDSNSVTVLRNLGGGSSPTFSRADYSTNGSGPFGLTSGDYNRDGLLDLAVTNANSQTVTVLRNTGGGFVTQQTIGGLSNSLFSIATLDFDRDGFQDLAAASSAGIVHILRNSGAASFAIDSTVSIPGAYDIAAADFDKDGRTDLVTSSASSSLAAVLRGTTNSAPNSLSISNSTVAENSAGGTVVGTLSSTDPNTLDVATYSILGGTDPRFEISGTTLRVKAGAILDFESTTSHAVTVVATDPYGATSSSTLTITVSNVNEVPTDINLSNSSVAENSATGTSVGNFSTMDPDAGNTFTYALVTGTGDIDNSSFTIVGNTLKTNAVFDFETKNSYTVRVRSTDQGGLSFEKAFTIIITNVNEAPTDIALDNGSIAENAGVNAPVGNLTGFDPDPLDDLVFSLPAGLSNNSLFNINGSLLQANASFDFESGSSYTVIIRATDSGNLTFDKQFTITVTNVNEVPTDISLSSSSVAENSASGTSVGNFSTTDPDAGNTFTYALVTGTGDTDNASFTITGNTIKTNAVFDFETKNSYTVRVRSTDQGGLSFEKAFTISVTDVNEVPTDISLSSSSVAENSASGTSVGNFSTTDADAGNTFTYALVTGTGDTDNASFTIAGNTLKTNAVFDFETKSSYSVRVQSTDQGGLSFEKAFTISVTNVTELSGIDVQLGQTQRSYVRYLDTVFDRADDLMTMINGGRFQLTRMDLNGLNPVNVPMTSGMMGVVGNSVRMDFGTQGVGGNRNSTVGDGYYRLGIDMDGNGSYESTRSFYRLLGDVNGDRKVDATDSSLVTSAFGTSNAERDVNGDGTVNSNDRTLVLRSVGRKLKDDLFADD